MKTPKQLEDIYISISLNTLSDSEHKIEVDRLKYILSAHPKPKRLRWQNLYYNTIQNLIYNNHTTDIYFLKQTGININNCTKEEVIKYFGSIEKGQKYFNKLSKETNRRIDSYYEKYRILLNAILDI